MREDSSESERGKSVAGITKKRETTDRPPLGGSPLKTSKKNGDNLSQEEINAVDFASNMWSQALREGEAKDKMILQLEETVKRLEKEVSDCQ